MCSAQWVMRAIWGILSELGRSLLRRAKYDYDKSVDAISKIIDPDLRNFAEDRGEHEPRSVIVELNATPLELPVDRSQRSGLPRIRFSIPADASQVNEEHQAMDKLERELAALGLGNDLVRLNTASAFVVNVSSDQLRAVSTLPLVGVIRPNRRHRAPVW